MISQKRQMLLLDRIFGTGNSVALFWLHCFEVYSAWFIYAAEFTFKMMLVDVLHRNDHILGTTNQFW